MQENACLGRGRSIGFSIPGHAERTSRCIWGALAARGPLLFREMPGAEAHDRRCGVTAGALQPEPVHTFEIVTSCRTGCSPWPCRLFCQLVAGVEYCHSRGVMHRDLRPDHVLLDGNVKWPTLKITAFHYSKDKVLDSMAKSKVGVPTFAAPGEWFGMSRWGDPLLMGQSAAQPSGACHCCHECQLVVMLTRCQLSHLPANSCLRVCSQALPCVPTSQGGSSASDEPEGLSKSADDNGTLQAVCHGRQPSLGCTLSQQGWSCPPGWAARSRTLSASSVKIQRQLLAGRRLSWQRVSVAAAGCIVQK